MSFPLEGGRMDSDQCLRCGGSIDQGHVTVGEAIRHISDRQTGAIRSPTIVKVAKACLSCGHVELYLDPAELSRKLPA
jgi:hypothetical protein